MTRRHSLRAAGGLAVALLLASAAWAADPSDPEISIDGEWVWGTVLISAPRGEVVDALKTPHNVVRWEGSGTQVTTTPDGSCLRVALDVPSAIGRIRYTERRCPTAEGYRSTLLESEDFDYFEATWVLETSEGGCRARYGLRSKPSFPVPRALAQRLTGRSIRKMLAGMRDELGAK